MKRIIMTDKAPAAIGPYSQAVLLEDGFLYTSGQLAIDPETKKVTGDIKEQTRKVLENLGNILKAAGADYSSVVKTTVFLADMGEFAEMNSVYATFFKENPPARSAVQVAKLPLDGKVEIEAVARIK